MSDAFFAAVRATIDQAQRSPLAAPLTETVAQAAEALQRATAGLAATDERVRAAAAYDLLTAFGILAIAWTWLDVLIAVEHLDDEGLVAGKRTMAQVWIERELPMVHAHVARIEHGATSLVSLPDAAV